MFMASVLTEDNLPKEVDDNKVDPSQAALLMSGKMH